MNKICGFCDKELSLLNQNDRLFDIFICDACQKPDFNTMYRQTYRSSDGVLLSESLFIDEFYVTWQHHYLYTKYHGAECCGITSIYKAPIGIIYSHPDPEPITWDWTNPVFCLNGIVELPLKDPRLLKNKLQIYTMFS